MFIQYLLHLVNRAIDYPLIIIGAGAAGLGASVKATAHGIRHVVLEASHRTGGRGLTELLENGVPVDFGCHWMHCARKNPFVQLADQLGFEYAQSNPAYRAFKDGTWAGDALGAERSAFLDSVSASVRAAYHTGQRVSIWDCMEQESLHCDWARYWLSLMHSNDPDQVSVSDMAEFDDTSEDWPLRQGYGALISASGASCPVKLNLPVSRIEWQTKGVKVSVPNGELIARKVLITVSTGVLAAGTVRFSPELPDWKQQAIHELPLGNYNNLFFPLASTKLLDAPDAIAYEKDGVCAAIRIRPFGDDYIFVTVAGRFAWWLEKQGERASSRWFSEILAEVLGSEIKRTLGDFRASAWGFDPWVRGAYSSSVPGAVNPREMLAQPLARKLYFAGEAASPRAFNTAHGAWISGQEAVQNIIDKD